MNPTAVSSTESATHLNDGRQRGWFWAENDILSLPISVFAKALYLSLARHADQDGASFPKVATIAEELGVGRIRAKEARREKSLLTTVSWMGSHFWGAK